MSDQSTADQRAEVDLDAVMQCLEIALWGKISNTWQRDAYARVQAVICDLLAQHLFLTPRKISDSARRAD